MNTTHARSRARIATTVALLASVALACDADSDADVEDYTEADASEDALGEDVEFRIADPTPVEADELLGMVRVSTWRGTCSGMLIANDRVLTAGHCFCTEGTVGGNVCNTAATVTFRPDPDVAGSGSTASGTATVHPDYNPSWTEIQIENDLAVIDLTSNAPAHVTRFEVASTQLPTGSSVMLVGWGNTGSDCDGPSGTLNFDIDTIDGYDDGTKLMRFNDVVICPGDSGGAVVDVAGSRIYGVHSNLGWSIWHGYVNNSIAVDEYYGWIKGLTCSTSMWTRCSGGPICECASGNGDCDNDDECQGSLVCAHDVGETFGLPAAADVCVGSSSNLPGSCGCGNSGLGNLCVPTVNQCNGGFSAVCGSTFGNCGSSGCTCQ
ncbi:MAG: S1 family peptidase [Deltaproteobacteria bacterium]|nr:S1 family peptidase [Deltaproteobacteria bacterium]